MPKLHLGVYLKRGRDDTGPFWELSASRSIKDLEGHIGRDLKEFAMPGAPGKVLTKHEGDKVEQSHYRSYVGRVLYPVKKCVQNCLNAVRELCGHLESPGEEHSTALRRLGGYLKYHYMPLKLRAPRQLRAGAKTDATWGSDHNDRKSINGDLIHIGRALVDYGSTKQTCIVQSSPEAELVSGAKGGMKVKFVEHVMDEVLGKDERVKPSFLMIDNEGAIHVVKNNAVTPNTKHIDIKTRYLQLEVQEERLEVQHVRTEECHADIEMKNLPEVVHEKHSQAIHNGIFGYIEDITVSNIRVLELMVGLRGAGTVMLRSVMGSER